MPAGIEGTEGDILRGSYHGGFASELLEDGSKMRPKMTVVPSWLLATGSRQSSPRKSSIPLVQEMKDIWNGLGRVTRNDSVSSTRIKSIDRANTVHGMRADLPDEDEEQDSPQAISPPSWHRRALFRTATIRKKSKNSPPTTRQRSSTPPPAIQCRPATPPSPVPFLDQFEQQDSVSDLPLPQPWTGTTSSDSSCASSIRGTTLFIQPSRALYAMQSTGGDIGRRSPYATWNRSTKYVSSQVSLTSSNAYQPIGSPRSLFDGMEGHSRAAEANETDAASVVEGNDNGAPYEDPFVDPPLEDQAEVEPNYGPSKEDMWDLFDREAKWQNDQRRRERQPLTRLASLSKDFKGEVKRRLSGKGKGFEARAKRVGEGSASGKGFRKSI